MLFGPARFILFDRIEVPLFKEAKDDIKYKYYSKMYNYIDRLQLNKFEDVYSIGDAYDLEATLYAFNDILKYFEKREQYERCSVIKKVLDIIDEGHLHVGHAGAKSGGHFKLFIVSDHFINMTVIERHKLIYKTLANLMQTEIHALSIEAKNPSEL